MTTHPERRALAALSIAVDLAGLPQGAGAGTVTYDFSSSNGGFTAAGTTGVGQAFSYTGTQWTVNGTGNPGGTSTLAAPVLTTLAGAVTLSFSHSYRFESGWDGGQLRVSINGGTDQIVGINIGSFSAGGYDERVDSLSGSGWTSDTLKTVTSIANLGTFEAGTTLAFNWLGAWDWGNVKPNPNWALTSVTIQDGITVPLPATPALVVLGLGALVARRRSRRAL